MYFNDFDPNDSCDEDYMNECVLCEYDENTNTLYETVSETLALAGITALAFSPLIVLVGVTINRGRRLKKAKKNYERANARSLVPFDKLTKRTFSLASFHDADDAGARGKEVKGAISKFFKELNGNYCEAYFNGDELVFAIVMRTKKKVSTKVSWSVQNDLDFGIEQKRTSTINVSEVNPKYKKHKLYYYVCAVAKHGMYNDDLWAWVDEQL